MKSKKTPKQMVEDLRKELTIHVDNLCTITNDLMASVNRLAEQVDTLERKVLGLEAAVNYCKEKLSDQQRKPWWKSW